MVLRIIHNTPGHSAMARFWSQDYTPLQEGWEMQSHSMLRGKGKRSGKYLDFSAEVHPAHHRISITFFLLHMEHIHLLPKEDDTKSTLVTSAQCGEISEACWVLHQVQRWLP